MGLLGILFELISAVLGLYIMVLVIHVVISWLFAFDVVSRRNEFVSAIARFTTALTEPVLRPLRKVIPTVAGVDLSVLVLVLALSLIQTRVLWWLYGVITGRGPVF